MTAAFFDLDNTLVSGSSLFIVLRHLVREGVLEKRLLLKAAVAHSAYRVTAREHGVGHASSKALRVIEGVPVARLEQWCRDALEPALPDIAYAGSLRLLRAHQNRGDLTFIASAAPVQVVTVIAAALGCDGGVGTVAHQEAGVFTGRLDTPVLRGVAKAEAVRQLAAQHALDLRDCSAYSDSHNDLPMLRLVGEPNAVNPDGRLRRVARAQSWPVHDVSVRRSAIKFAAGTAAVAGSAAVGYGVIRAMRGSA